MLQITERVFHPTWGNHPIFDCQARRAKKESNPVLEGQVTLFIAARLSGDKMALRGKP